ncbi:MAG: tetratricopeptide repeat protein [Candidatus Riflebacteria bacterium]|nr:tetratricopeptide repeat protein [Candidatus Riflebacteria bacterium]
MRTKVIAILLIGIVLLGCSSTDDAKRLVQIDRKLNSGQFENVIQESKEYLQKYPDSCRGWNILGWAYLNSNNLEDAEKSFDKAIAIDKKWDNAYVGKGVMYRKMGQLDKARQNYLQAVSLVPDNAEAFSSLLVIELMAKNNKKAVEYGEKAWKLRKNLPSIPANLAVAYHYINDHAKRDEFFKHASDAGYSNLQGLKDIFSGKSSIGAQ